MAEIETLQELYIDELKDLWSANDQMAKALKKIVGQATNGKLKDMLQSSQDGIAKHTDVLKALIEGQDEKLKKEHCKGMEAWSPRRSSTPSRRRPRPGRCSMRRSSRSISA